MIDSRLQIIVDHLDAAEELRGVLAGERTSTSSPLDFHYLEVAAMYIEMATSSVLAADSTNREGLWRGVF